MLNPKWCTREMVDAWEELEETTRGVNPYEVQARSLKAMRLALILEEAGLRRGREVWELDDTSRRLALEVLGAGLGRSGVTASRATWLGVARLVAYLGHGRAVKR